MTVRELIDMLGQYPSNADVEVVGGFDWSMPLTREGLEIDYGETLSRRAMTRRISARR